jgi:murein DD-endopeptidase MepM/ murein hydrolase activator NlpD
MLRGLVTFLLLAVIAASGLYVAAGRSAPPLLAIDQPTHAVGQRGELQVTAAGARLSSLVISLEQGGKTVTLFTLATPGASPEAAPHGAAIVHVDADHLRVTRPFGKEAVPELQSGPARLVVSAERKSFLNLRTLASSASKDVQVRLEPPRLSVVSTHHYVNHGGAEMVVYRATPADVLSGVRVGDIEYRGFPLPGGDPSVHAAFFALLHDQDLATPITAFARDEAGNETHVSFVDNVFDKPFKRSRIEIDDRFLARVVPQILEHAPELTKRPPADDLLQGFLAVNGELRRMNAEEITAATARTDPSRLWEGPFTPLGNAQVEASFADHRTYIYKQAEVDHQVHLGFDLAVTANVPVLAGNRGKVVHASWLGIYGNCVIIDHGMGVASLYGHLSSIDVHVGDSVTKGQTLGRSGMTGLAGGDHLHFTMLVGGHPVNPVEWWDPHWVQDRVDRKLREFGRP